MSPIPYSAYDLTIIGGGSGGLTAASIAAALGARTLLIDKTRLGGECLYTGCVPSKSLIHIARMVKQTRDAAQRGLLPANTQVDMANISAAIQQVIGQVAENEKVLTAGVTVAFGAVSFTSPTALLLNGEPLKSLKTIIATGSRAFVPAIAGLAETGYLTNEDVFDLSRLPVSLIVVGGGPVGVELAQALARLGVRVTIVARSERLLPKEDPEVSALLASVLQSEGITLVTGSVLVGAVRRGAKKVVTLQRGEQLVDIEADELLLALGRQPNVEHLNLEAAGVAYTMKGIQVDVHLQSTTPTILAIGDVIGAYLFTHVAAYQAGVAVRNALLPIAKTKVNYRVVPWCTFTEPEIARVGLTPAEASQQHKQVRVVTLPLALVDRAQTDNVPTGFLKFVLAGKKEAIVGAHMAGAHAGELLGEVALAMRHHLTLVDLRSTIHAYPTIANGIQQLALEAYLQGDTIKGHRKLVRFLLKLRRSLARLRR